MEKARPLCYKDMYVPRADWTPLSLRAGADDDLEGCGLTSQFVGTASSVFGIDQEHCISTESSTLTRPELYHQHDRLMDLEAH